MKPKVNETIYLVYHGSIHKIKVYMLGETEFCHNQAFDQDKLMSFRRPLKYEEENITWFRKLKDAKEKLNNDYPGGTIIKLDKDYWEKR